MKVFILSILSCLLLYSCITIKPKDFTFLYDAKDTGLNNKIDISGCYITQQGCDTVFFSVFMFYPDGLFTIATGPNLNEVIKCFGNNLQSVICKYPSWGTYRLIGDTVKTQTIRDEGAAMSTIFRDYLILSDDGIVNVSDYVHPENTKIGYMKNYPSFNDNRCLKAAVFHELDDKRNSSHCPYLKKKWFKK